MNTAANVAEIWLWGNRVGAVALDSQVGVFEYDADFLKLGLDIAPVTMPLEEARRGNTLHSFPALNPETFKRLPGLLADALPDKFGQAIVDTWLARQGRGPSDFSIIERLCYTGSRAVGALEFTPAVIKHLDKAVRVDIDEMLNLVHEIINHGKRIDVRLTNDEHDNQAALLDILRIGTSAGGARAKAVIAYNEDTGEIKSGQAKTPKGYKHWLLKFDGASDIELGKTEGFGRIEYAYYLMAKAAGINMMESRLLEENERAHFMTRRFDRIDDKKIHTQSLCAIAHYDFNMAGAYGYEQALMIMRKLKLSKKEQLQLYRRMVFNVASRNHDDHTKNISFLMNQDGVWELSPAFDMMYSYNPTGEWTHQHQMTINGKRDKFTKNDLLDVATSNNLKDAEKVIQEVLDAVTQWPDFAKQAGLDKKRIEHIRNNHRVSL